MLDLAGIKGTYVQRVSGRRLLILLAVLLVQALVAVGVGYLITALQEPDPTMGSGDTVTIVLVGAWMATLLRFLASPRTLITQEGITITVTWHEVHYPWERVLQAIPAGRWRPAVLVVQVLRTRRRVSLPAVPGSVVERLDAALRARTW